MKRYFVVGTDTDCGKTYVTCQLMKHWRQQGHRVRALKPVASGSRVLSDSRLVNDDVLQLEAHQTPFKPPFAGELCKWMFKPAIAPHLAAESVGVRLSASDIAAFCRMPFEDNVDAVLVEGAGGLMVPLNERETWLDVLRLSGMSVILVVGMRLGCINHALLTDYALNSHGIDCVGWVANCFDPMMEKLDENLNALSIRLSMPLLDVIQYGGGFSASIPLVN